MSTAIISGAMSIPVFSTEITNATAGGKPSAVGADAINPPLAGEQLEVSSANIQDDDTGTGAQQSKLIYLDSAFALLSEDLEHVGSGQIATVDLDIARLMAWQFTRYGSTGVSAATMTLRTQGGAGTDYAPTASRSRAGFGC